MIKIQNSPEIIISNNIGPHEMAWLEEFLEEEKYLGPGVWVMSLYGLCLTDPLIELTWWNRVRHPRRWTDEKFRRRLVAEWLDYLIIEGKNL